MEKTIAFLKSLSKNNNREWFEKNKPKFLVAKEEFEHFVTALVNEITKFDGSLMGLDPKKFIFRIYRDVRFSKDKRPYKTNFGAGISSNGKGLGRPGYYLHVEPGGKSFVAGGLYMPEPEILGKVRQEIDYSGDELRKIMSNKKFKNLYRDFWDEDKLKTMPKGYPKDHRCIEWLKLKSFIVTH
ncbi:MAG TPA: DUF2461 domain-containing protein, partial [Cyclobacteriaceae bacterium]|nr:DUF2461 domain-containing protein [Cyclobacteriaceae bacterium]